MTTTPTGRDIAIALLALGDTADRVAATLTAGGWHGERKECTRCPVAVFLSSRFPNCSIMVGDIEARVATADGHYAQADLPDPVADFILDFDRGRYRELVEA